MVVKAGYYADKFKEASIHASHNKPTLGTAEEAAAQRVIRSGWVAQDKK